MNNKILVIEDSKSKISEDYECPKLEYVNQSKDENIHLWLIKNKKLLFEAERLITKVSELLKS